MNIASNKNFPIFNLKDTFIYSKNFTTPKQLSVSFFAPPSPFFIPKSNKPHLAPLLTKKTFTEYSNIPTQSDEKSDKSKSLKKKISPLTPYLNDHEKSEEFDPNAILEHLNYLEKSPQNKNALFSKLRIKKKKVNMKSMDFGQEHRNINKLVDSSSKKGYLEFSPLLNSKLTSKKSKQDFEVTDLNKCLKKSISIFDNNKSNHSSNASNISKTKKNLLRIQCRLETIPNYPKLLEVLRKIHLNFREINEKNENKLMIIHLLQNFIPPKKIYLRGLFFMGDRLNPIINEKTLENACIIQENQYGIGFKERLLRPGIIRDLEELNSLMEEHNLKKETVEIKFLEENVKESFNAVCKLKSREFWLSKVDLLNYEKINRNTIIDDLVEAEKYLGRFECIAPKQKTVAKLIDEAIVNLRRSNRRDSLEVKYLQESYKMT